MISPRYMWLRVKLKGPEVISLRFVVEAGLSLFTGRLADHRGGPFSFWCCCLLASGSVPIGQLGDVHRDAPGLVAGEQMRRRPSSRLFLEVHIGERVAVGVADDEARVRLLDGLWRRKAAQLRHGGRSGDGPAGFEGGPSSGRAVTCPCVLGAFGIIEFSVSIVLTSRNATRALPTYNARAKDRCIAEKQSAPANRSAGWENRKPPTPVGRLIAMLNSEVEEFFIRLARVGIKRSAIMAQRSFPQTRKRARPAVG